MTGDHENIIRLDGRCAVVTGAGRGLGRAYATLLAARGADVVVNNRSEASATEVVRTINAQGGGRAVADIRAVGTLDAAQAIVKTALDAFDRVDIVVNNAGYAHNNPVEGVTPEIIAEQISVHLMGALWLNQTAWPLMKAAGYGRIINTTSGTILGFPDSSGYLSAKAAVVGLSRALAYEGEALGIKVNCIAPLARTMDLFGHAAFDRLNVEWKAESVAPLVVLLAHDSCPVNGEVFTAGGGRVGRLFFGETLGFIDPDLSPESLVAHFAEVEDITGFRIFRDAPHAAQTRLKLVRQACTQETPS